MKNFAILLSVLVILSGCSRLPMIEQQRGPITVGFCVSGASKVTTDATTGTFSWEDGDNIALWASNSQGEEVLSSQSFQLMAQNEATSTAYFTSTLPSAMPDGTYQYNCLYPYPNNISGDEAHYTIPDRQNALEVAPCILYGNASSGALGEINESLAIKPEQTLSLHLKSMLHYLRFFIPEGSNMLGEPVREISFTMPQACAGSIYANYKGSNAGSTRLISGTNTITISGLNLQEGADQYALAAIIPASRAYTRDENISVTLYGDTKYASIHPISLQGRYFKAGHITSVALRARELHDFYKLRFSLKENNLGEDVQTLRLRLSDGSLWPGTESSTLSFSKDNGPIELSEILELKLKQKSDYQALNGKAVSIEYESENAVVSEIIVLNIDTSSNISTRELICPYLFAEDFSGASTSFDIGGALNAGGHSANTISGDAHSLPGWTASQSSILEDNGNKFLSIRHRNETFVATQGTYRGRADSPPMSAIKEGHSVKVEVSFKYTGYASGKHTPQISYGYGTSQGEIAGYYEAGSSLIKGGKLIENIVGNLITTPKDGSPSNINIDASYEIQSCTSLTRLAWDCYGTKDATANTNEWVFIDNITVKITK